MCGIAGLWELAAPGNYDPAAAALRMANAIAHRGPDGHGAWGDAAVGIGLGHRRLAVIDLTDTGKQPMASATGRYVITYNGEVYNFRELRADLEARGHLFRGTSDTEVMLAACEEWGPEAAVKKFVGMFALALFDRQECKLRLIRDRLGVKPLYWTMCGNTLLFGSELRALMAHPKFKKEVDPEAIDAVVRLSYVPSPATVFRNVHKLPPASILTIRRGAAPHISSYWNFVDVANQSPQPLTEPEAIEALDALLLDSVKRRLIADVPVGAFLSGGMDSTAVVAMMERVANREVHTFTVGIEDPEFNEASQARAVAHHFGTKHTEVAFSPGAVADLITNAADWFDEPFADPSQLPTYLVAKSTRAHVTVALSGDGGDELFAGYPKYDILNRMWRFASALPRPGRVALGKLLLSSPTAVLRLSSHLVAPPRRERIEEKARRLGAALVAKNIDEASIAIATVGLDTSGLVPDARGLRRLEPTAGLHTVDSISRMQAQDVLNYLPDDILTKVDRCSMAVSLEAREPLIDHRLIEFVWSLPAELRHGDGRQKFLLQRVLDRYLPSGFVEQPKRGFSIPVGTWLKGPWRPWAENLLEKQNMLPCFDARKVQQLWRNHISGAQNNATTLWNILTVQGWARRWL